MATCITATKSPPSQWSRRDCPGDATPHAPSREASGNVGAKVVMAMQSFTGDQAVRMSLSFCVTRKRYWRPRCEMTSSPLAPSSSPLVMLRTPSGDGAGARAGGEVSPDRG